MVVFMFYFKIQCLFFKNMAKCDVVHFEQTINVLFLSELITNKLLF